MFHVSTITTTITTITGSSQSLSPFWLMETNRELSQIPGATSNSLFEPSAEQSPAFSLLHAAAITGDVEGYLNAHGLTETSAQVFQN